MQLCGTDILCNSYIGKTYVEQSIFWQRQQYHSDIFVSAVRAEYAL